MANIVLFANNDQTTLAGAITSTALTANLSPGSGVLFPSPVTGQYFPMTFVDAATGLLREIVYVTNVTGDVITMTRAQEGTTALAWNAGDIAANLLTAGSMNLMVQTPQMQAMSGNASTNSASITGTTTLTAAQAGSAFSLNSTSAYQVTLPGAAGLSAGAQFDMYCTNSAGVTIAAPAGVTMITGVGQAVVAGSVVLYGGETASFNFIGGEWQLTGGSVAQRLSAVGGGNLINVQIFSASGTYTPTPGTSSVIVECIGGGGGSGGVAATSASQCGISPPGGAGAYAKSRLTTGFSGVSVAVGAAGSGGAAGATSGTSGGTSSFGGLVSSPGGNGAPNGITSSSFPFNTGTTSSSPAPTGGNIIAAKGLGGAQALAAGLIVATGMHATPSVFGAGAGQGASGVYLAPSSSATAGSAGNAGLVMVWEYT
jgi:hypothetical protein